MKPPTAADLDELRLTVRPIEGPKCAQCGQPVGMVQINGHSFSVAPKALVIQGGTILLSLHLCPTNGAATGPPTPGPKRKAR